LIGLPGIGSATLGWSDAPLHLFDGVFVRDFVNAEPRDGRAWAEQFYLRHPAIGIGVYYPPGFAAIEAVVFSIFGVSIVAARALVVAFAVGACILLYQVGRNWFDRTTGLFAVAFLLTMPHAAFWMRDVMLEWPATFWILAAVAAYQLDTRGKHAGWGAVTWLAVLAAFLTKQTAGFIGPVIAVHALLMPTRRAYWARVAPWTGLTIAALFIATYAWITRNITALAPKLTAWSPDLLFYPRHLPEIAGVAFVPILVLSIGWMLIQRRSDSLVLMALSVIGWYLFSSIIEAKEPRYFFYALPFLALIAASVFSSRPKAQTSGANEGSLITSRRIPKIVILTCIVFFQGWRSYVTIPAELPRYSAAANFIADQPDADLVLIDAVRDGQFVFDLYSNPSTRDRIIPLRASKLLYARAAREKYDYRQFVESPADIVALLDKYGIRYIVMESQLPDTHYRDADPPPRHMLRELVESDPRFVRRLDQSLACGDPSWNNVRLRVFEYTACPPRSSNTLRFDMPGMGRSITLTLPAARTAK